MKHDYSHTFNYIFSAQGLMVLSIGFATAVALIGSILIWSLKKKQHKLFEEFMYPKTKLNYKQLHMITAAAFFYLCIACTLILTIKFNEFYQ